LIPIEEDQHPCMLKLTCHNFISIFHKPSQFLFPKFLSVPLFNCSSTNVLKIHVSYDHAQVDRFRSFYTLNEGIVYIIRSSEEHCICWLKKIYIRTHKNPHSDAYLLQSGVQNGHKYRVTYEQL